jgi:hypothetical protein
MESFFTCVSFSRLTALMTSLAASAIVFGFKKMRKPPKCSIAIVSGGRTEVRLRSNRHAKKFPRLSGLRGV